MNADYPILALNLGSALTAGGVIGLERTIHGHPAGFRTHALVCLACSLLMLMTSYQSHWLHGASAASIGADTSRMAQGIMTGIGFLGAGVIFKEGLTVRGLTTAASIWVTAAIGILVGIGFWFAAIVGAISTLIVLALFRFIEARLPSEFYAHHTLRFPKKRVMDETEMRAMIGKYGFSIANLSSRLVEGGQQFEYRMTIKSRDRLAAERLSKHLRGMPDVIEFRIAPTGD